MKTPNYALLIVVLLIAGTSGFNDMQRDLGYNRTTSLSEWVSWIADSSKKMCNHTWDISPLESDASYCWDSWDISTVCGGDPYYECTTDTGISGDARYILWPDSSIWNNQHEDMHRYTSTKTFHPISLIPQILVNIILIHGVPTLLDTISMLHQFQMLTWQFMKKWAFPHILSKTLYQAQAVILCPLDN